MKMSALDSSHRARRFSICEGEGMCSRGISAAVFFASHVHGVVRFRCFAMSSVGRVFCNVASVSMCDIERLCLK